MFILVPSTHQGVVSSIYYTVEADNIIHLYLYNMSNPNDSNVDLWFSLSGHFELTWLPDQGWLADDGLTLRRGGNNQKRGGR